MDSHNFDRLTGGSVLLRARQAVGFRNEESVKPLHPIGEATAQLKDVFLTQGKVLYPESCYRYSTLHVNLKFLDGTDGKFRGFALSFSSSSGSYKANYVVFALFLRSTQHR